MRICSVPGCDKKHFVHGYCNAHRLRVRRHGSTDLPNRVLPPEERFWPKVDKGGANGCWVWTASTTGGPGYGQFFDGSKMEKAHRFAYELLVGPIPADLQIDHLCRNRLCCNPDHLEAVTPAENARRAVQVRLAA